MRLSNANNVLSAFTKYDGNKSFFCPGDSAEKLLNVISNENQRTFVYQLRSTLVKGDISV